MLNRRVIRVWVFICLVADGGKSWLDLWDADDGHVRRPSRPYRPAPQFSVAAESQEGLLSLYACAWFWAKVMPGVRFRGCAVIAFHVICPVIYDFY